MSNLSLLLLINIRLESSHDQLRIVNKVGKQAGAELGQAQLKLELGFTSLKPVALNLLLD